ncbi:MAG: ribosomal large subunit pseudouridine synthase D [Gemmatales bacterium]|nr:MAG: ribosomal large subunit pseudouridine synthase D [Gemmatales bacterium]
MKSQSFIVSRAESGKTVAMVTSARLSRSPRSLRRWFAEQRIHVEGKVCRNPRRRVHAGQEIRIIAERRDEKDRAKRPLIVYEDKHIVVVNKPAGITTMRHAYEAAEFGSRAQRFLPRTLADEVLAYYRRRGLTKPRLYAVHRLDKETSGLVVFARTKDAERHLGHQFRLHSVGRLYLAVVRGRAKSQRIASRIVRDRGDGRRGSALNPKLGKWAVTHVRVLENLGDYTLVECRLETGRTHQVRIHLGEQGTPLCGERVYDRPRHGRPLPDDSGFPRLALHATYLAIDHPETGQRMEWTAPLPADFDRALQRLRRKAQPKP